MNNEPLANIPPLIIPPRIIPQGRPCIGCGYNLFGLNPDGNCPECGTLVANSLRGDLLEHCGPEYLAALHAGVFWILASVLIQCIEMLSSWVYSMVLRGSMMTTIFQGAMNSGSSNNLGATASTMQTAQAAQLTHIK